MLSPDFLDGRTLLHDAWRHGQGVLFLWDPTEMATHGWALKPPAGLSWWWETVLANQIFYCLLIFLWYIGNLYSPLVFPFWITFVWVIFVLEVTLELILLIALSLGVVFMIVNGWLKILRRCIDHIQYVLVDFQWLWNSVTEALVPVERGYSSDEFFLGRDVLLLFVVQLLAHRALIDAVRLHVQLLHFYDLVWKVWFNLLLKLFWILVYYLSYR